MTAQTTQAPPELDLSKLDNTGFLRINWPGPPPAERTLIVLGVARSGTTMVSGALHHLGIDMGMGGKPNTVYEDVALSDDASVAMYRVAQEALANIGKHAQARAVTVQLFCDETEAALEIADDGNGFDPGMLSTTPGFGLRGLLERARGLGGWAEVASRPGAGTTIMFTLPLSGPSPREEEHTE